MLVDEAYDGGLELGDALVNAAADLLFGDQGKEALDLVQPRRTGRRQVDAPARALEHPVPDQLRPVRGVFVHHEVDVEVLGHTGVDPVEKAAELGRVGETVVSPEVARVALADDATCGDVRRCEQAGRAVARLVVGAARSPARAHGQHTLAAVERLDFAIFVHTKHQRPVWRGHIKANDVAHPSGGSATGCFAVGSPRGDGHEVRVGGQLERFQTMRLQAECAPDALHGGHRQAARPRHAARTPVCRVLRHACQGGRDQRFDPLVLQGAGRTGPRLVAQAPDPLIGKAPPPLTNRVLA